MNQLPTDILFWDLALLGQSSFDFKIEILRDTSLTSSFLFPIQPRLEGVEQEDWASEL